MIDIPPEVQIRSSIRRGSVYYFKEHSFSSDVSHYFIVLNRYPATDRVLLLVCPSSQIEKVRHRRRNLPAGTLVEIKQDEYLDFAVDSIVDCNTVIQKTVGELVSKLSQGNLKVKSTMPMEILGKLRSAVQLSPMVSEEDKEVLGIPVVHNRVNSGV
jgi:hypothetical protein